MLFSLFKINIFKIAPPFQKKRIRGFENQIPEVKSCLFASWWEFCWDTKVIINRGMNKGCLKLIRQRDLEEPSSDPAFQPSTSGTEAGTLRHNISNLFRWTWWEEKLNAISEHTQVFVISVLGSLGLQIARYSYLVQFLYLNQNCCQNNLP